jgi:hypothetical protein
MATVGIGIHLVDQRNEGGNGPHTSKGRSRDIEEVSTGGLGDRFSHWPALFIEIVFRAPRTMTFFSSD